MIAGIIEQHIQLIKSIQEDQNLTAKISSSIDMIVSSYQSDKKLLLCGNGGSASDAQHIAAELTGRFLHDRPALFAEALHVNSAFVTAVANDYGYDHVYARGIEAKGVAGDVLIAISTSGNSANIIKAIHSAKAKKMTVIGLTGAAGGAMKDLCDILINVPSDHTPRIQEAHIMIGHIICEGIEKGFFSEK